MTESLLSDIEHRDRSRHLNHLWMPDGVQRVVVPADDAAGIALMVQVIAGEWLG